MGTEPSFPLQFCCVWRLPCPREYYAPTKITSQYEGGRLKNPKMYHPTKGAAFCSPPTPSTRKRQMAWSYPFRSWTSLDSPIAFETGAQSGKPRGRCTKTTTILKTSKRQSQRTRE